MKDQINQTIQRTQRYWYTDGLAEIATGMMILLFGLAYLPILLLPPGLSALVMGIGLPAALLLFAWLSRRAVRSLKERITYPRTGYVAYPRKKRSRTARAAVVSMAIATAAVIGQAAIAQREYLIPILCGASFGIVCALLGYRLGLARFYLLAAFCLLLGVTTQQLGLSGLQQYAFLFSGIGLGWVVSGAVTLIQYLRNTRSLAGGQE